MSAACCGAKDATLLKMVKEQKRVLWIVLIINLSMFGVEIISGFFADSVSLLGDSLDMLGDSLAYGVSLAVVGQSLEAKVWSARIKGSIILLSSILVLGLSLYRVFFQKMPMPEAMGLVGIAALAANLICLILLTRHKTNDVNMSSVWLCSRNDIIANISVLLAAVLVSLTRSPWPDLVVGTSLAILFANSARHIFSESKRVLRART